MLFRSLLAFGVALAITALIELVRRLQPWRWFRHSRPDEAQDEGPDQNPEHAPDHDAGQPEPAASDQSRT